MDTRRFLSGLVAFLFAFTQAVPSFPADTLRNVTAENPATIVGLEEHLQSVSSALTSSESTLGEAMAGTRSQILSEVPPDLLKAPAILVVLAAGEGTRMGGTVPKPAIQAHGKPMIRFSKDAAQSLGIPVVAIVGKQVDILREALGPGAILVHMPKATLGTASSVLIAEELLRGYQGTILVALGDMPWHEPQILKRLLEAHQTSGTQATYLTAEVSHPEGLARVVRLADGTFAGEVQVGDLKILAERGKTLSLKDGTVLSADDIAKKKEVGTGTYAFDAKYLFEALKLIRNDNEKGEFYLPSVLSVLEEQGHKISTAAIVEEAIMSVDTPKALQDAETLLAQRTLARPIQEWTTNDWIAALDRALTLLQDPAIRDGFVGEGRPLGDFLAGAATLNTAWHRLGLGVLAELVDIYGPVPQQIEGEVKRYLRVIQAFEEKNGSGEVVLVRAPGRGMLMGAHNDYNWGPELLLTLPVDTLAVIRKRTDSLVRLFSTDARFPSREFNIARELPLARRGDWNKILEETGVPPADWANYLKGSILFWQNRYPHEEFHGMDLMVDSTLPMDRGVSSSSALVVISGMGIQWVNQKTMDPIEMAQVCCFAEWYVGTRGGGLDHAISILGQRGHALKLLPDSAEPLAISLPPGYRFVMADSLIPADKTGTVRNAFNQRSAETRVLGLALFKARFPEYANRIQYLRDITAENLRLTEDKIDAMVESLPETVSQKDLVKEVPEAVAQLTRSYQGLPEPPGGWKIRQRVRHIVQEVRRVEKASSALQAGDMKAFGSLMHQSFESCRRDYEITVPWLDELADLAREIPGVFGVGIQGGGFGGFAMILAEENAVGFLSERLFEHYYKPRGLADKKDLELKKVLFAVSPSRGAGLVLPKLPTSSSHLPVTTGLEEQAQKVSTATIIEETVMSVDTPAALREIENRLAQRSLARLVEQWTTSDWIAALDRALVLLQQKEVREGLVVEGRPLADFLANVPSLDTAWHWLGLAVLAELVAIYGPDPAYVEQEVRRYLRTVQEFEAIYGLGPAWFLRAPGRGILMGGHNDYNWGAELLTTLPVDTLAVVRGRADTGVHLATTDPRFSEQRFDMTQELPPSKRGDWNRILEETGVPPFNWTNYLKGSVLFWQNQYPQEELRGFDLLVDSTLPMERGISSSSALVVIAGIAIQLFNGKLVDPQQMAELCCFAEWYVGTRGGGLDHAISILGQRGHALKLLPDSPQAIAVPLPAGHHFVMADSLVPSDKTGSVRNAFNQRSAETRLLGVALFKARFPQYADRIQYLRDVTAQNLGVAEAEIDAMVEQLPEAITTEELAKEISDAVTELSRSYKGLPEPPGGWRIRQRVRHITRELRRVERAVEALQKTDVATFGKLMDEAYASYRDDYEITVPDLEELVGLARSVPGVLGANLQGDFGGFTMILVSDGALERLVDTLLERYYKLRGLDRSQVMGKVLFVATPSRGAGVVVPQVTPSTAGLEEVLSFGEIQPDESRWSRKGSRLAQMKQAGLLVPDGFVLAVSTFSQLHRQTRQIPRELWAKVKKQVSALEQSSGRRFGDSRKPLILAVRPGAEEALPGLMATVIGVGLNDETVHGLAKEIGEQAAYDAYARFLWHYAVDIVGIDRSKLPTPPPRGATVESLKDLAGRYQELIQQEGGESFPQDSRQQLARTLLGVASSWDRPEVWLYRQARGLLQEQGMAIVVQQVVFGNVPDEASGAGLLYTRDPQTGEGRSGWFLLGGQGEDLMTKASDWGPTKEAFQAVYGQQEGEFAEVARKLEFLFGIPQMAEFVIEKGRLYIVQTDDLQLTPLAKLTAVKAMKEDGLIGAEAYETQLASLPRSREQLDYYIESHRVLATGYPVGEGTVAGRLVFVSDTIQMADESFGKGKAIVVVSEMDGHVREAVIHRRVEGLILTGSRLALHDETLLRTLGIPALMSAVVKRSEKAVNATLVVGAHEGILFRGAPIPSEDGSTPFREVTIIPEGTSWSDYTLRRKRGLGAQFEGSVLQKFDYDAGLVEEFHIHMGGGSAPPGSFEYLGTRPLSFPELYEVVTSTGGQLQDPGVTIQVEDAKAGLLLRDKDPQRREAAARALGEFRFDNYWARMAAIVEVAHAASKENVPRVKEAMSITLAKLLGKADLRAGLEEVLWPQETPLSFKNIEPILIFQAAGGFGDASYLVKLVDAFNMRGITPIVAVVGEKEAQESALAKFRQLKKEIPPVTYMLWREESGRFLESDGWPVPGNRKLRPVLIQHFSLVDPDRARDTVERLVPKLFEPLYPQHQGRFLLIGYIEPGSAFGYLKPDQGEYLNLYLTPPGVSGSLEPNAIHTGHLFDRRLKSLIEEMQSTSTDDYRKYLLARLDLPDTGAYEDALKRKTWVAFYTSQGGSIHQLNALMEALLLSAHHDAVIFTFFGNNPRLRYYPDHYWKPHQRIVDDLKDNPNVRFQDFTGIFGSHVPEGKGAPILIINLPPLSLELNRRLSGAVDLLIAPGYNTLAEAIAMAASQVGPKVVLSFPLFTVQREIHEKTLQAIGADKTLKDVAAFHRLRDPDFTQSEFAQAVKRLARLLGDRREQNRFQRDMARLASLSMRRTGRPTDGNLSNRLLELLALADRDALEVNEIVGSSHSPPITRSGLEEQVVTSAVTKTDWGWVPKTQTGMLKGSSFFTRMSNVVTPLQFFVDTREDSRTLRLAVLAAVVKAREGWPIEFRGVARQEELDDALQTLDGDIGAQVILENRVATYESDVDYLEKRAEALSHLPAGVPVIVRLTQDRLAWFDQALEAAGLKYASDDLRRSVRAFLEAV